MATALDIAKRNPNAASVAVSDAARASGPDRLAIEKKAELSVAPGTALGGTSLVGLTREQLQRKARRNRRARARAEDARGAALALDLPPRRHRISPR